MLFRTVVVAISVAMAFAVAPAAQASARTYHVALTGSNTAAGSEAAPWRTIDHALRQLHPGDTLVVRGGTYVERVRSPSIRAASATAPVTVRAATGERPIVKGLLWIKGASHWTFDGINVTWDDATGQSNEHMVKLTDGVGWTFKNAEVWGARSFAGMLIASSVSGEPADWRVAGNCIHDTYPANSRNQDQLIYANPDIVGRGGVIEHNLLFNAPNGNGIKLGGPSATSGGAGGVIVRYNTVFNAAQGVMAAWRSRENVIERNIIGRTGSTYGAVRSFELDNSTNVARDNVGFEAATMLLHYASPDGQVQDGGGNRFPVDPQFDSTATCADFRPANTLTTSYGHLAGTDAPAPAPAPDDSLMPQPEPEPTASPTPTKEKNGKRLAGSGRVKTSAFVAEHAWTSAETVVLARADEPADALAGSALAGKLGAPLLVNPQHALDADVAATLRRLGVKRAVLLGGTAALGVDVASGLESLGISVDRIAGRDRAETAAAIADRLVPGSASSALLVRGSFPEQPQRSWPDALAVSGLAARRAAAGDPWPVLVTGSSLPATTALALARHGVSSAIIVGGTGTVPASVESALGSTGLRASRLAGASRYATSRAAAELDAAPPGRPLIVATGDGFADGLTAGALAAKLDTTLLLVPTRQLDAEHVAWISARAHRFDGFIVVGGTAAISETAAAQIGDALGR